MTTTGLLALLAGLLPFLGGQESPTLSLELRAPTSVIELGQGLELQVRYGNVGSDAFYLVRPDDLGRGTLTISASGHGCEYHAQFAHVAGPLEGQRLQFVPLQPGDVLETWNPPLNLCWLAELYLSSTGDYSLRATYTSSGSPVVGLIWPIWRGNIESEPIQITILPPSEKNVDQMRKKLGGSHSEREEACCYFRFVRDSRAADLLVDLLETTYDKGPPPSLVDAIVSQGREEDSVVLDRLSSTDRLPEELRLFYADAAKRIRTGVEDPCR